MRWKPAEYFGRFRQEIAAHSLDEGAATTHWQMRCREIEKDASAGSPFDFLRWPSFSDFSVPEEWIPSCYYEDLLAQPDWSSRWFPLTRETKIGAPKDFSLDPGTSPILVQHAYHLMCYERATKRSLIDCDVVFEIGGGYGSFCRVLRDAGFSGLHIIYDLPHVSSIQRLYLGQSGFREVLPPKVELCAEHGFCLVTGTHLDAVFACLEEHRLKTAFVATWSLSEMPMNGRQQIFPRFHRICSNYLIAYQPLWDTINNGDYFAGVSRGRPDLNWHSPDMPRAGGPTNFYLMG